MGLRNRGSSGSANFDHRSREKATKNQRYVNDNVFDCEERADFALSASEDFYESSRSEAILLMTNIFVFKFVNFLDYLTSFVLSNWRFSLGELCTITSKVVFAMKFPFRGTEWLFRIF